MFRTPDIQETLLFLAPVCWLGGWAKHRLYYLVMVMRVKP